MRTLVFNGESVQTITKSIQSFLGIEARKFRNYLEEYLLLNYLREPEISFSNFIDYYASNGIDFQTVKKIYKKVIFFHKSSIYKNKNGFIDFGLIPLPEVLMEKNPFNDYLIEHGVNIFFENNKWMIQIENEISEIHSFNNESSSIKRGENAVYVRLYSREGTGGYLFFDQLQNDSSYNHIVNIPEFYYFLDQWKPGIFTDWIKNSTPVILECIVNIEEIEYFDGLISSEFELTEKILEEGFSYIANEYYFKNFNIPRNYNHPYAFLKRGLTIPPRKITKVIE